MIEIADLSVAYGPVEALPPFSLSVAAGETVVLTGLSGCGKSTVLRALCGLLPEEATVRGTCRVDGLDTLAKPAELPRHVAYVPQNPAHALFCTTVREEVEAGPLHLGLDDPSGRAERAMDALGCASLAGRAVRELSSGQQQRVAIAAALASGPRVLIMDEPTSYLDRSGLAALREGLERLKGVTLVIAEHRLDRLPEVDRVVEMAASPGTLSPPGGRGQGEVGQFGDVLFEGSKASAKETSSVRPPSPCPLPPGGERVPGEDSSSGDFRVAGGDARATSSLPSAPEAWALRATGIQMSFGGRRVLDGIDLDIGAGETVALLGDNGTGKTTLARVLAGLQKPTGGRVTDGAGRRMRPGVDVALTPPNPTENLFCDTVEEEVRFGAENSHLANRPELMETLRLEGLEGRRPHSLSLGQQQRVSVAAALAVRPRLVILDEPTIGQDRAALAGLFESLAQLAEEGIATLLVTHDETMARRFATRTLRLEGGKLYA